MAYSSARFSSTYCVNIPTTGLLLSFFHTAIISSISDSPSRGIYLISSDQKADKTEIIIYRSTKKNSGYAMYKKVKTSGATYTVTNTLNVKGSILVKGKRYYYKARVYRVIDGRTYYGPMSGVKYMRAK